jgi:ABC-type Na+ transport system ATPase subunit NatA
VANALVIETVALEKRYEDLKAVAGLDLRVPAGSIYGFLGRNGSGKTTTIKMLLGMTRPSGGHVRVFGLPADASDTSVAIRRRTGFVSEEKDLYDYMSVVEMIRFTAAFYPRWRGDLEQRYLRTFGLPVRQKVRALSRGTRTKLALLLALCRGADLLILDEPTSGLDPAATEEVLQMLVAHVAGEGLTVFFSSHQGGTGKSTTTRSASNCRRMSRRVSTRSLSTCPMLHRGCETIRDTRSDSPTPARGKTRPASTIWASASASRRDRIGFPSRSDVGSSAWARRNGSCWRTTSNGRSATNT